MFCLIQNSWGRQPEHFRLFKKATKPKTISRGEGKERNNKSKIK
jgi:hypothetical protein